MKFSFSTIMKQRNSRFFAVIAAVFIPFGCFLRLWQLGELPASVYWDEIAMVVDAKTISESGKDMHGDSWLTPLFVSYGDFKLPVLIWLSAFFSLFFGPSAVAVRLPSALAGIATVFVAGYCAYLLLQQKKTHERHGELFAVVAGIATSCVVALSPWGVLFSRTGFEGNVSQVLLASSVVVFLQFRKNYLSRVVSMSLGTVLGVLSVYTYFSTRFVWPFAAVGALLLANWPQLNKRTSDGVAKITTWLLATSIVIGFVLAGFFLLLQPMFNSPLYEQSNQYRLSTPSLLENHDEVVASNVYRKIAGDTVFDRIFFHRWNLTFRTWLSHLSETLSVNFLFLFGDQNLRHGTGITGLFYLSMLPALMLGMLSLFMRNTKVFLFLATWWLAALLPATIPNEVPHALRSLNALVPISIFIGTGIAWLFEKSRLLSGNTSVNRFSLGIGVLLIGVLLELSMFLHTYFIVYPKLSYAHWQDGYAEIATAAIDASQAGRTVVIDSIDQRLFLWVLADTRIGTNEIQTLLQGKSEIQEIRSISFAGVSGSDLKKYSQEVTIISTIEKVAELSAQFPGQIDSVQVLDSPTNRQRFAIAVFNLSITSASVMAE